MLSLKHVKKSQPFIYSFFLINKTLVFTSSFTSSAPSSTITNQFLPYNTQASVQEIINIQSSDVVSSFKEWFKSQNNALFDRIYEILSSQGEELNSDNSTDLPLSRLGLRLNESFVLGVLNYGKDVLSCLKFFDWAGRQPGFNHTRATFNAIFKILSRAKLMSLMVDFLGNYRKHRYVHQVRFNDTLVMGYAVAGKPDTALQLFGKMRFQGLDLDAFAYHVLLNALVEESCFDAVDVIAKQITMRGFENEVTHNIMIKCYCKQDRLNVAESHLRELVSSGRALDGHVVSIVVDGLCKKKHFERAGQLIEEFRKSGLVVMEPAYNLWIKGLVQAGKPDEALEFLQSKKVSEGYVPDVFRYNFLICRLLRDNRLEEVCDLLMEMKESQLSPDKVTMNAAMCFFCKAGMIDIALELYKARAEFRLSPNFMAYNYLINTLCGDGSIDEAYRVLKNSMDQGYFPRRKTFSLIADALCREGKLDKMKELIVFALERNFMPSDSTYDNFISALCKAKKVEDGYLLHGELNRLNRVTSIITYCNLIHGFNKTNRGDIAARLLIEMQEKGHNPARNLYRTVIRSLCNMDYPETQFLRLLEMQLSRHEPNRQIYNFFIEGAGHAKKPELAREVFEMMGKNGIMPNLNSDILMLQSYLRSIRISDALNFFNDLRGRRKIGRKLYNTMVTGLCRANKLDAALDFLTEMRENGVRPSLECYEVLILSLCSNKQFDMVVHLINDLEKVGRPISSFIGNVLLLHSLGTHGLYESWVRLRKVQDGGTSHSVLGKLIGAFSGRIRMDEHVEDLEELIGSCFQLDLYTYNLLLRRLSIKQIDLAQEFFNRMCKKGFEPNRWTYDILVHSFFKHGRTAEAKRYLEEMFRKGFYPTERTKLFI